MECIFRCLLVTLSLLLAVAEAQNTDLDIQQDEPQTSRDGKLLSLFSIVQFKNEPCRSNSIVGSTARNGTCYTQEECRSRGGSNQGGCAAGFGVCCLFTRQTTGSINQNCTYIQNPGFPNAYTDTAAVSYTINKCGSDVCTLRLDFNTFTTLGPTDSKETTGGECRDKMTTTTSAGAVIPIICGQNTGQHMYVDMGYGASDTATLAFTFNAAAGTRNWEIKVTQVSCRGITKPPKGCLQWHQGATGRITTFNFPPTTESHLAKQDYSICIRQEKGFCCVRYQVCQDAATMGTAMTLYVKDGGADTKAMVDSLCTSDFVGISGASATCNKPGGGVAAPVHTKFCGAKLNVEANAKVNIPVCDCTSPFAVRIFTDMVSDEGAGDNKHVSRGVCLEYTQIPC